MNKNSKIKILVASGLAILIPATTIVATNVALSKKSPYDGQTIVSDYLQQSDLYLDTLLNSTDLYDESLSYNEEHNNEYDELKSRLNAVINEKGFDEEVSNYLINIFKDLYNNYDSVFDIYKDCNLPTRKEYINQFINNIDKNVSNIIVFDRNDFSNEYYASLLGSAKGRFVIAEDLILVDKECPTMEATIFEEIIHSGQDSLFNSPNVRTGKYQILIEGEANYFKGFLNCDMEYVAKKILVDENTKCIINGPSSTMNSLYCRYYGMLLTLTDYKTLSDCKENFNEDILIQNIQNNYNIDATEFLNLIYQVVDEVEFGYTADTINKVYEIEKMYCECLKQKASTLDSEKEIFEFMNFYRFYKMQYGIKCTQQDENYNLTNITSDKMSGYDEIEKQLFEKMLSLNMLPENHEMDCFKVLTSNLLEESCKGQPKNLSNLMYCLVDNKLVFVSKNSKDMLSYNSETSSLYYFDFNKEIYDACTPVIRVKNEKNFSIRM